MSLTEVKDRGPVWVFKDRKSSNAELDVSTGVLRGQSVLTDGPRVWDLLSRSEESNSPGWHHTRTFNCSFM